MIWAMSSPSQAAMFEPMEATLPDKPSQRPTKELWRFVKYYTSNIRNFSQAECSGVIRAIQRMVDKGIPLEDIALALENYKDDPWRKANPRYSKHIRSFYTPETIKEWLTPRPAIQKPTSPAFNFEASEKPAPAVPVSETSSNDVDL